MNRNSDIKRRALLASDDPSLTVLLPALLAPTGYLVTAVSRGCYSKSDAVNYDLLIIDGDPKVYFDEGLPAVVSVDPEDAIAAYERGVDLVILKPMRAKVFMAKIRAILRRYGIEL